MSEITPDFEFPEDSNRVPDYTEFSELGLEFLELVKDALHYREREKDIKARAKDLDLDIMQYMARLPAEVKSVRALGATVTFVDAGSSSRLDKGKLKKILLRAGIPADQIREMFVEATVTSARAGSIRIRTSKNEDEDAE